MKLVIIALHFVALLVLVKAEAKPSTALNSPQPPQPPRLEGEQAGCNDGGKSKPTVTAVVNQVPTVKVQVTPVPNATIVKAQQPQQPTNQFQPLVPPTAQVTTVKPALAPIASTVQVSTLKPIIPPAAQASTVKPALAPTVQVSTLKPLIPFTTLTSTLKLVAGSIVPAVQSSTMKPASVSPAAVVASSTNKPLVTSNVPAVQASTVKVTEASTKNSEANKQTQQQTTQKPTVVTTTTQTTASTTQKIKVEDNNKKPEQVTPSKAVPPVVVSTAKPKEDKPESHKNEPAIHQMNHDQWKGTQQRSSEEEDNDDNYDDEDDFDEYDDENDENDEPLSTFELDRRVSKEIEKRYMQDIERVLRFVFDVSNLKHHKEIDQTLFETAPFEASLKCMNREQYRKIRENIGECERIAHDIFTSRTSHSGQSEKTHKQHHEYRDSQRYNRQDMHRAVCHDSQEDEINKAHEMFVAKCLIKSIVASDTNKVIRLDIMKMRMEIGNTSLPKPNQAKAVEDLEKCISKPREMWHLAEILSDSKPIVKRLITPMVFTMFNNKNEQSNSASIKQELKKLGDVQVDLAILKGMVCFFESLAKNGCGTINHNNHRYKGFLSVFN